MVGVWEHHRDYMAVLDWQKMLDVDTKPLPHKVKSFGLRTRELCRMCSPYHLDQANAVSVWRVRCVARSQKQR